MVTISVYSAHQFEIPFLTATTSDLFSFNFIQGPLSKESASQCAGSEGIAIFTSDDASAEVLEILASQHIKFICTRSAGYDHIDVQKASALSIAVSNVPAYSPHAIAEHSVAMMLALSRHLIKAHDNISRNNYSIDSLVGFNLHYKTVGIIGTGRIGSVVSKILHGFGCNILAYDVNKNDLLVEKYNTTYVSLEELLRKADIITLHAPLNEFTKNMINGETIASMKEGVMIINTSRGKLINTEHLIETLESGKIGSAGLDVYENEKGIFFHDLSKNGMQDIMLKKLNSFENVLITAHQAFLTKEALKNIADTTMMNIELSLKGQPNSNELT